MNKGTVVLIDPQELTWHERVSLHHAAYTILKMLLSGRFDVPLLVDSRTKTILDGHHRCYAARRLGLRKVPCFLVDYFDDQSIAVYSRREGILVNKQEVVRMALSEGVFPQKTTRHEYKIPSFKPFALSELWKE